MQSQPTGSVGAVSRSGSDRAGIEAAWRDLRYGLRQLRKSWSFAVVATLTLAAGIGANTAIFSFVNAILLRPLPYPQPERLAIIWSGLGYSNRAPFSSYELFQLRERSREFDQIAGIWVTNGTLPGQDQAEQIKVGVVTSNLLSLLCARPALGRLFSTEDEETGSQKRLILSYGIWARRFGSDPTIVGRSIRFGSSSGVVTGVLPRNFRLLFPDDASVPANVDVFYAIPVTAGAPGGPAFLHLIGRLRAGASIATAQSEADAIARQVNALAVRQALSKFRMYIFSLQDDDVRAVRNPLLILFGGVALVLLIACANVASLLMERGRHRIKELTVRLALGASRGRLVRQLLTESLILACFGALGGVAIAWAGIRAILVVQPPSLVNVTDLSLDGTVLAFTFALAVVTSVLFGLGPAISAGRADLAHGLREAGRPAGWRGQHGPRLLIAGEVALAFVLLAGTGLLTRTFINVLKVDPGFQSQGVYALRLSGPGYPMLRQLQQNLSTVPGVQSVSAISHLPLDDTGNWYDYYWKENTPEEQQNTAMADMRCVLPGYFRTIGATFVRGRDFTMTDDTAHEHAGIIDDVLANRLWPGGDALGRKLNVSDSPDGPYQFVRDWIIVVGIVRHVQYHSLTSIVRPQVYLPFPLAPRPNMAMVIRTDPALPGLAGIARKEVGKLNKNVALSRLEPLSLSVRRALAETGFASLMATLLSSIALVLASTGTYGMLSYSVARRTSEIGIRMAIGAGYWNVMKLLLVDVLVPVSMGLIAGLLLSFAAAPLLSRLLFGVTPYSGTNYAIIVAATLLVSASAAALPVRRATRINPLVAIRHE